MGHERARHGAAYFKALPKVELHLHLEGALTPRVLLKLAERNRLRLPFSRPEDFARFYQYGSFKDFANALLLGVACLRKPEDFFDAVQELGRGLESENIRYAEVTWTPQFYLNRGYPLDVLLEAMNAARHELRQRSGIQLQWIPDLVRSFPQPAKLVATWASSKAAREAGVVALGLGGPEDGHPARVFESVFALARSAGLPANPHAGEGAGPSSMWETIRSLRPIRIGHGVRACEDKALISYLALERIPLEISITSNVRLGIFPDYESHPVKDLIRAGCVVTLNTDDPVLFGTSLSEEYLLAVTRCGLELADIHNSILVAIQSSYLPASDKVATLKWFIGEFDRLEPAPPDAS